MSKHKLFLIFSIWLTLPSFAQADLFARAVGDDEQICDEYAIKFEKGFSEVRTENSVNCGGKYCEYVPSNARPANLVHMTRAAAFGSSSDPFLEDEGYLRESPPPKQGIEFHAEDSCSLARMIFYAQYHDKPILARDPKDIKVKVTIYTVSESTIRELSIGATGVFEGVIDSDTPRGMINTMGSSWWGLSAAFGT
ncbi:MAG: hypothetical protein R2827_14885 [Bdellovibrionales bacterium]